MGTKVVFFFPPRILPFERIVVFFFFFDQLSYEFFWILEFFIYGRWLFQIYRHRYTSLKFFLILKIFHLHAITHHKTNSTLNFLSNVKTKGKDSSLTIRSCIYYANIKFSKMARRTNVVWNIRKIFFWFRDKLSVAGMAGSMGQAGMGSYYGPAAAYGSLSAASMAAAAAAAAQQSAAAMSAGLAAPAQVSRCIS